jgi:hypothetical protein
VIASTSPAPATRWSCDGTDFNSPDCNGRARALTPGSPDCNGSREPDYPSSPTATGRATAPTPQPAGLQRSKKDGTDSRRADCNGSRQHHSPARGLQRVVRDTDYPSSPDCNGSCESTDSPARRTATGRASTDLPARRTATARAKHRPSQQLAGLQPQVVQETDYPSSPDCNGSREAPIIPARWTATGRESTDRSAYRTATVGEATTIPARRIATGRAEVLTIPARRTATGRATAPTIPARRTATGPAGTDSQLAGLQRGLRAQTT